MTEVANQTDSKVSPLMQAGTPKPLGSISAPREASYNYKMYPVNLASAAIVGQCVEIQGEKIYYMEGQSRLRIRMESLNNDYIDLYPGRKIVCPFHRFFIDAPRADEVVKLLISSPHWVQMHGEGVEVNTLVRDKSLFRETELKRAYIGSTSGSAVAGEYTALQLFNPVASNVVAIVKTIIPRPSTSGAINAGGTNILFVTSTQQGTNKYIYQNASVCSINVDSDAAMANLLPLAYRWTTSTLFVNNTNMSSILLNDNIILKPGYGVAVSCIAVNLPISCNFEWVELPLANISSF